MISPIYINRQLSQALNHLDVQLFVANRDEQIRVLVEYHKGAPLEVNNLLVRIFKQLKSYGDQGIVYVIVYGRPLGESKIQWKYGMKLPSQEMRAVPLPDLPSTPLQGYKTLYLTAPNDINEQVPLIAQATRLWMDTEVADYKSKKPRLSLIQLLVQDGPLANTVLMLDVLDQPELVELFISEVMSSPRIEKIFHNADYDLRFLGKASAQNVACTLKMARSLPYYLLSTTEKSLKALAEHLCGITDIDKSEQASDWGQRPLSESQLYYASLDTVYLAQVHQKLLPRVESFKVDPLTDDLATLEDRLKALEHIWKVFDSEVTSIKDRAKQAMIRQEIGETDCFKLSEQSTSKVDFFELAKLALAENLDLDLKISLNQALRKSLGEERVQQLNLHSTTSHTMRMKSSLDS